MKNWDCIFDAISKATGTKFSGAHLMPIGNDKVSDTHAKNTLSSALPLTQFSVLLLKLRVLKRCEKLTHSRCRGSSSAASLVLGLI
jgi:hypothetical protein